MQQSNITTFQSYSNFTTLKQFNSSMEQWWIDIHQQKLLTRSEIVALKRLTRYCSDVYGVSNAKIATIVSATHEYDGAGISRSTFKRMVQKCVDMGLLTVESLERKNGSRSSNLYIFNPYILLSEQVEPSKDKKLNHHKSSNLSKSNNLNNKDIRTESVDSFENYAQNFFEDKIIKELYKISRIHANINGLTSNQRISASLECLKVLVTKMKSKPISNHRGYFNGVCKKRMRSLGIKQRVHDYYDKSAEDNYYKGLSMEIWGA
jgi:hypothetical protein